MIHNVGNVSKRDGWPNGRKAFVHSTLGTKRVYWNSKEKLASGLDVGKERDLKGRDTSGVKAIWQRDGAASGHKLKFSSLSFAPSSTWTWKRDNDWTLVWLSWHARTFDTRWINLSVQTVQTEHKTDRTHIYMTFFHYFEVGPTSYETLCIFPDYVRHFYFQVSISRLISILNFHVIYSEYNTITRY